MAEAEPNGQEGGKPAEPMGQQGAKPAGEDWEAKYRAAMKHMREWESRAKANQSAADELEKLRESGKTELERANDRAAKAERERDELKAARDAEEWRREVSKATGVPAEVLEGSTKEAMEEHAARLAPYFKTDAAPVVGSDGRRPKGAAKTAEEMFSDALDFIL